MSGRQQTAAVRKTFWCYYR